MKQKCASLEVGELVKLPPHLHKGGIIMLRLLAIVCVGIAIPLVLSAMLSVMVFVSSKTPDISILTKANRVAYVSAALVAISLLLVIVSM